MLPKSFHTILVTLGFLYLSPVTACAMPIWRDPGVAAPVVMVWGGYGFGGGDGYRGGYWRGGYRRGWAGGYRRGWRR